jgi:hypothetical protein
LQACKLTDSAETSGKKNLTFEQVNLMLDANGLLTDEIRAITARMKRYRDLVVKSRHWMISHLDLTAVMAEESVGAHDKEDWADFLSSMYKYTDVVGSAVGVGPLDYKGASGPGDANDLIMHLENSLKLGLK